jgi:AcrR family transcriptional regulator
MPTARKPASSHGDLTDRILDAAERLVFRTGARKMSLSEVATLAGVSRPTIYRYFVSKEELIDALGKRERRRFRAAMDTAMEGVVGVARLEAAVDVVATFLEEQPPGRLLDLEPRFAHEQMTQALPMLTDVLMLALLRCAREDAFATPVDPADLASAIARTALSHYIFPDAHEFRLGLARRRVKRLMRDRRSALRRRHDLSLGTGHSSPSLLLENRG